jgi:hypothetical protein
MLYVSYYLVNMASATKYCVQYIGPDYMIFILLNFSKLVKDGSTLDVNCMLVVFNLLQSNFLM